MTAELAGILAILIAGAISIVASSLSKEQKISEFRQAWIDGLRDDIAQFLSSAQSFSRSIQAHNLNLASGTNEYSVHFSDDQIANLRLTASQSKYRISLRLNSSETAHKELLNSIEKSITIQNEIIDSRSTDIEPITDLMDEISNRTSLILKQEWNRVKSGEQSFRRITNYSLIVMIACLVTYAIIQIQ